MENVDEQLTPTLTENERPLASLLETSHAAMALLHSLRSVAVRKKMTGYALPVLWMYSSASVQRLDVHSNIEIALLNCCHEVR